MHIHKSPLGFRYTPGTSQAVVITAISATTSLLVPLVTSDISTIIPLTNLRCFYDLVALSVTGIRYQHIKIETLATINYCMLQMVYRSWFTWIKTMEMCFLSEDTEKTPEDVSRTQKDCPRGFPCKRLNAIRKECQHELDRYFQSVTKNNFFTVASRHHMSKSVLKGLLIQHHVGQW